MGLYSTGPLPFEAVRKYSVMPAPTGGRVPAPIAAPAGLAAVAPSGGAEVAALVAPLAADADLCSPMARVISAPVSGPRRYDSAQRVFISTGASSCTLRIRNTRCVRLPISASR